MRNTRNLLLCVFLISFCCSCHLSVDNDEKKSESIETQVTLIKEFIQKHNENPSREYEIVVYDIYSDLGKTGTNFDRPGFERMMNDVMVGKINCILVKDFSRFVFLISFCCPCHLSHLFPTLCPMFCIKPSYDFHFLNHILITDVNFNLLIFININFIYGQCQQCAIQFFDFQ